MDDISIEFESLNHRMLKPFDSLVESIVEFNMEENSMNCSKGFEDRPVENEQEIVRRYIEKCLNLVPDAEGAQESQVGLLDFINPKNKGLYLIDPIEKKIDLFFFEQNPGAIPLKELLAKKDSISRVNSEMFDALKTGEAGLDHESLVSLANMLIDSLPERMNKLAAAMKQSLWEEIKGQAHYLKSSFGVMGLERLSWLTANLELAAKSKDLDSALASYELIYPELLLAVRFLRNEFMVPESI